MEKWRYTIITERDNGDIVEVARFSTSDLAQLFLKAASEQYSSLHFELDDIYREHTLADLLNGELEY